MFACIFCIEVAHACFCFLGGGHDGVDDLAIDEDRPVERWCRVIGFDWKRWFVG